MRHHRRHRHHDEISWTGFAVKYGLLGLLLVGVGGATWLALTPLGAPTEEVTRVIPNDRFK